MVQLINFALVASFSSLSLAFPSMPLDFQAASVPKSKRAPGFNAAAQKISTSGDHKYVAPGSGDQRGPCPGLNALANHNYIPHNGVATIQQFIDSTNAVFGMGLDLATFLAVYGAVFDGDLKSWSIGGPPGGGSGSNSLLSQGQGISYSHNKYESDASPTRGDLYLDGDAYKLKLNQFKQLYAYQSSVSNDQANYDLNILTDFRSKRFAASKANNPYFYNGAFTGVAVQPAAYTFIYRFMANKSAEHPEGVLNKDVLKSFFAISGDDNNLQWNEGQERIPDNWYKRAIGDEYTIPFFSSDLTAAALQHPEFLDVGGNQGKGNSFAGVDVSASVIRVSGAEPVIAATGMAGCEGA